ncbi:MAG: PIG-L family deacetylase [Chloroflexia bacterium]
MNRQSEPLTLMAVHAHPDDEVVFTGGLLPLYHDRGVRTVLVCCTGGEQGEIHDPDLDPEADKHRLGEIRAGELRCAVEVLKIDALEMLNYPDSGMEGTEANADPNCFFQSSREEETARLVKLVRRYKPQVLVTYNEYGAYGHPDHIAAHQITTAAYDAAGDPDYLPELGAAWTPLKLYWTAWNEEGFERAQEMYKERGLRWPWDEDEDEAKDAEAEATEKEAEEKPPPYKPPPITTRIDVRDYMPQKLAAFACHRTQFMREGLFRSIPEDIAVVAFGVDALTLVKSRVEAPPTETDLFTGIV